MSTDSRNPYRPLPSLVDIKISQVATRLAEKNEKINPTPIIDPFQDPGFIPTEESTGSSLLDVAQADMLRAGGSLADVGKSGINKLFGTNLDSSQETGYSNQEVADLAAGVTPEQRARGQAQQQAVLENVSQGNILGSLASAAKAAPFTLASSAGVLPELAAGAALTAAGGAGIGVWAKKIKDIANTVDSVHDQYENVKNSSRLQKLGKGVVDTIKAAPRAAGQASLLTADIANQQINEYEAEHGPASTQRKAAIALGALATTIVQPAIISKLFIPDFKKQIVKEGATLLKNMGKGSNLVQLGKRVVDGGTKVMAAAGAEAAQEYVQTWQEILSTQISPEEADNLFEAIQNELLSDSNQNEAITGGLLGGAAGGAARTAIAAPVVAAGGATDIAKGTVKTTAKIAKNVANKAANKASLKVLNEEERAVLQNDYDARRTVVDQKTADLDSKIQVVKDSATLDDLKAQPEISIVVERIQKENGITDDTLQDTRQVQKVKEKVIAAYKADKALLRTELEASNIARIAKEAGKNVVDKTVAKARAAIKDIPVEELVETVKDLGDQAVTAAREIKSSTARGIVDMAVNEGDTKRKTIVNAAKGLDLDDLKRVTAIVGTMSPKLGNSLKAVVREKEKAQERIGQKVNDLITEGTIPQPIVDIAKAGKVKAEEAAAIAVTLNKTLNSKIADSKALETVKAALESYKNSPIFKEGGVGVLNEKTMRVLEGKLDRATKKLNKIDTDQVKDKISAAGKQIKEKVVATAKEVKKAFDEEVGKKEEAPKRKLKVAEGKIHDAFSKIETSVSKPSSRKILITGAADVAQFLKDTGYTTREDLADFMDQYPGIKNDPEVYQAIQEEFDTNVEMREETDSMQTDPISDENLVDIDENIYPGCKA